MADKFDVFLCHNSQDKPVVRTLAESLQNRGLKVWLDEWELIPGRRWQDELEKVIEGGHVRTAAVLVGPDGVGPWQNMELRVFLDEFVRCGLPVIPVLLPEAPSGLKLPVFLRSFTWVDLRPSLSDNGLDRLIWGITGRKPASPPLDPPKEPDPVPARADSTQPEEIFETSPRFTDNGNGTVTDLKTGLIWLKKADCFGRLKWGDAITACQNLSDGQCGLKDGSKAGDWRLPTIDELKSLVHDDDGHFSRPGDPFVGVQSDHYWSSTTNAHNTSVAWIVFMIGDHSHASSLNKTYYGYVWAVRGGK
ncbi:MAG: DUF1566 domain-containing protein [Deltaproteobacteria bacterium]|nr:DUF1566 domain-containing protein [Deltaproteobacteria bacterium]